MAADGPPRAPAVAAGRGPGAHRSGARGARRGGPEARRAWVRRACRGSLQVDVTFRSGCPCAHGQGSFSYIVLSSEVRNCKSKADTAACTLLILFFRKKT